MSYKQASAHVQYNGFISNNFAISQGVGQGRVIYAWFFSLYKNDLISEKSFDLQLGKSLCIH
jgi:hypothetical protein